MNTPRAVSTGLGAITDLGSTIPDIWQNLLDGVSGIRQITQFDASELPCQIAGEIPEFDPLDFLDKKEARRLARSSQIALAAAKLAGGGSFFFDLHCAYSLPQSLEKSTPQSVFLEKRFRGL